MCLLRVVRSITSLCFEEPFFGTEKTRDSNMVEGGLRKWHSLTAGRRLALKQFCLVPTELVALEMVVSLSIASGNLEELLLETIWVHLLPSILGNIGEVSPLSSH